MSAPLVAILKRHRLTRRALGAGLGLARSTVSHWLGHGRRPVCATQEAVQTWLEAQGVPREEAAGWDRPGKDAAGNSSFILHPSPFPKKKPAEAATPPGASTDLEDLEDPPMLMRRQPIHQATRRHFGLTCDPFGRDLEAAADVYESPDIRYVRESMWSTAKFGGLLAVVGESGSGKTTLLDDIEERIARTAEPVVLVRPAVAGMEATEGRGQVLRVGHLQEAIIHALAPDAALKQSPQGRAEQLRRALIGARDAGQRVCLAIDEAHAMPAPTLRHLKRLLEVKQGFARLLAIVILGQPELGVRLSERSPDLREVVQRAEVVTLDPLDDRLEDYYRHKLAAAGVALADLADRGALDAMRERLGVTGARRGGSRAYPLAAGNLFAAALNLAASLGQTAPITAATVRGV